MTDLADITARHVAVQLVEGNDDVVYCDWCGQGPWPCDAAKLAALLTPERLAAVVDRKMAHALSVAEQYEDDEAEAAFGLGRLAGLQEAKDAILAALTSTEPSGG